MNLDKTPKKFNPEALKIIKEMEDLKTPAAVMITAVQKAQELREEIHEELKKQSAIMREIAEKGDTRLDALKEEAREKVKKVEFLHKDIVNRLREVQPELKNIEFKMDLEEGTYTPTEVRGEQEVKHEEVTDEIKKMVADLLRKVGS